MSLTIASILAESSVRYADRTAVVLGDLRLTYKQLWDHSRQYAQVLRDKGVGAGDKVAILLPNTPHFPLTYFAVLSLGAVAVPVHALLKSCRTRAPSCSSARRRCSARAPRAPSSPACRSWP